MTKPQVLLNEYRLSHQNPSNIWIHKFCVPLIYFSIFWMLSKVYFVDYPNFNLANISSILVLMYYARFSFKIFLQMFIFTIIIALLVEQCNFYIDNGIIIALGIFIISWIFQFIGHKIEGKKPSFLKDLQFLLIGPIWVFSAKNHE